ncbi:MAG: hypothetical protein GX652_05470 [Burkholderiaceae bacterium]|nr:hypothetical protein [Burkholderiaceae bacterium]
MLHKKSLAVVAMTAVIAACGGGGGSDTAVSANPPAPGTPDAGQAPAPGVDNTTPITAPSPSPGKVPSPLPPPPPAPAGTTYSGAELQRAMGQSIPVIGNTGTTQESGQYVHDGLDNPLAGYIASDGRTWRTFTLTASGSGYNRSREAALEITQANGGIVPKVDGVQYQGEPFDPSASYPANVIARTWNAPDGSGNHVKLLPSTKPEHPGLLRLCWEIKTAAAFRLACSHHAADGHVFGADLIEDIDGQIVSFDWQWEATPRPDGQPYQIGDYAPGGIAALPTRIMTCVRRTIGPDGRTDTSTQPVTLTPSEIRVGDEVLLRHGNLRTTVTTEGDIVTYAHEDALPIAAVQRSYRLRAGELLSVNWAIIGGASGFTSECN